MAGTAAGAAKRAAKTPQDRQAPRAPRVRRSTPAEPAEAPAARLEVLAEHAPDPDAGTGDALADDGSVRVHFHGHVFDLRSPGDWRNSAQEGLANGLYGTWARGVMYPESAALWVELDLTNRECNAFMQAYDAAFRARYGDDPKAAVQRLGLSPSAPTSSR